MIFEPPKHLSSELIGFPWQSGQNPESVAPSGVSCAAPLVRRMVIGSAITAGIMLYPCGVAPQANGSAAGCRVISLVWGAGFGLIHHLIFRDRLETVYVAKKEAAASSVVRDWRGESSRALKLRLLGGVRTEFLELPSP